MKNPKAPNLVTVLIFTTITIIFWVFFSVYQILTGNLVVDIPEELLKPINPTLDKEVLGNLPKQIFFEEGDIVSPLIVPSVEEFIPPEIVTELPVVEEVPVEEVPVSESPVQETVTPTETPTQ